MLARTLCLILAMGVAQAFVPQRAWGTMRAAVVTEARDTGLGTRFDRKKLSWKGEVRKADEVAAGFSYDHFGEVLSKTEYAFGRGAIIKGTVVQFDNQGAMVDIGAKSAAYVPVRECSLVPVGSVSEVLEIDETRDFQIISDENEDGQLMVSIKRLEYAKAWENVVAAQAEDKTFEGVITGVNRGGCMVTVHGLRGFLPGSHLCNALPTEDIIGQTFKLKFLEVNQEASKLVVSNRRAVVDEASNNMERGQVLTGIVKAIKPYGAFVEVNGISGLLHISQVSYDRIDDLEKVLAFNQMVKVMIIDHDKVNGRIALSTKTLEPEPGDMLKDPKKVFDMAEETAAKYHERMEAERKAREEAAKDIVMGLGDLDASFSGSSDLEDILNPTPAAE